MKTRAKWSTLIRVESDALGAVEVPFDALYGAQTARAVQNFPISGITIGQLPDLICALALIKKAAAQTNVELLQIAPDRGSVIETVCDEILSGQHYQHFSVDVLQGGAGTSTNMNINEVIANRGLELMGRANGDYTYLHPNDDVNRSQSTNDVYPTAIRLALMRAVPRLVEALTDLSAAFAEKGKEFASIQKLGRTELQDAVPMTLGAEMRAYSVTILEDVERLKAAVGLLTAINLGGTAIGTGIAAPEGYATRVVGRLAKLSGIPLKSSADLVEASWDVGVFVHVSGTLKRVATKLSKIANDLRLLSSGPRGGFGEIRLPPMQLGSSIMPGKVNPVIAEMVNQVAFIVIGTDVTISFAAEGGQLQLNAFEPLIVYGILQSIQLLRNASEVFRERCVEGIEADKERCLSNLEASTANFAALVPIIGYGRASALAQEMLRTGRSWSDLDQNVTKPIK